ncbi:MAG: hypothetical protein NT027_04170 [Proteobacteria bacterium]|nr:hypothetical protein [Pseudomonadota bacterium]
MAAIGMSESSGGKFNSIDMQIVNIIGPDEQVANIKKVLQALQFVTVKAPKSLDEVDINAQFMVIVADFLNLPALQALARFMMHIPNFSGERIVYATNPLTLSNEELLYGVEINVKQTIFGPRRDSDLKDYIKKQAVEQSQNGSMSFIEREVHKVLAKKDQKLIQNWIDRLKKMDKTSESVNRLFVVIYESIGETKKVIFHLKQTLAANPLNLWAANKLGTHYLLSGEPAEGIAILKKLSRFHELNAERMLVLGTAYLNAGDVSGAQDTLQKGHVLTGGADERFSEGLAKVDLMKGQPSIALERIGRKYLSNSILSFLNTRAVMAVRNGAVDEGLKLYRQAISCSDPKEQVVRAKIYFNQGLAEVRNHQVSMAEQSFVQSLELGGSKFNRASGPLAITRQLVAKQTAKQKMVVGQSLGDSGHSASQYGPLDSVDSLNQFDFES